MYMSRVMMDAMKARSRRQQSRGAEECKRNARGEGLEFLLRLLRQETCSTDEHFFIGQGKRANGLEFVKEKRRRCGVSGHYR